MIAKWTVATVSVVAACCALLIVGGCPAPTSPGTDGNSERPTPKDTAVSALIDAGGGEVRSEALGATLTIPPGALTAPTEISIKAGPTDLFFHGQPCETTYEFGPPGTVFAQPVHITLPYPSTADSAKVQVFWLNENALVWEPFPTVAVDATRLTITADTTHFTTVTVQQGQSDITFDIRLYNHYGQIAVGAWLTTPLAQMPTDPLTLLEYGALNVAQLVDEHPAVVHPLLKVVLMKKSLVEWFDPEVGRQAIIYGPHVFSGNTGEVEEVAAWEFDDLSTIIYTHPVTSFDELERNYSGEPMLFLFGEPEADAEYYALVFFYYADRVAPWPDYLASGGILGKTGYCFSTRDDARSFGDLYPSPDDDNDLIVNAFDDTPGGIHAPIAQDQSVSTDFDCQVKITLSASDSDGDSLTFAIVQQPAHGTLWNEPPEVYYRPDGGYYGADSFTFKANDGILDSNTATVSITVRGPTPIERPDPPVLASPPNGDTDLGLNVGLSWTGGARAESFDVYFGTSGNPPYLGNADGLGYMLGTLEYSTTYYWRVVAKNESGEASSPVWHFSTQAVPTQPPDAPWGPSPANGATDISINADLDWGDAARATSYDVYFGTTNPPPPCGNRTTSSFALPTLSLNTTYYWKVIAKNGVGSTAGPIWSFTTSNEVPVNQPPVASDQSVTTPVDTPKEITLQATDPDNGPQALTYFVVDSPTHGQLTGTPPNVTYTPTGGYVGTDSFTFRAYDGAAYSNVATVSVTVSTSVVSTFDTDSDEWQVVELNDYDGPYRAIKHGPGTPSWNSTGGNPAGCISWTNIWQGTFYFQAPAKFLGNQAALYGGALSWDIRCGAYNYQSADVILLSDSLVLVNYDPPQATADWQTMSVALLETAGWHIDNRNGRSPTQAEFQSVLAGLTAVRIRGEFSGAAVTTYLDNVVLQP